MEGYCSTGQSPQRAVVPMEKRRREDGQRNCPKHVEFHFQNKFEKLVYLIGFIIRK
jgi:hypothetical protein